MSRRDQGTGRGWQGEGRESQTQQQAERGRWSRESRGESGRRTEYDRPTGEWSPGGDERERLGPQSDWSEREPRDDSEWSEYRGGREEERYRGGSDAAARYRGEYGGDGGRGRNYGPVNRGYRPPPREETYGETQRWERTPVDMGNFGGGYYSGGAYAGGSAGGGAYGPGGFGGHGHSAGMWEGVAGRGTPPEWTTEERERSYGRGHSGKGPKGYQRSSERITEDVCDALTRHPDVDASEISVRCENGEVILSGTVHDRYEKRIAEDAAQRVAGVMDVRNEIRVSRPPEEELRG